MSLRLILYLGLCLLELVFDLLPELAKVEVPLLLHALHHQLHLQDLQKFIQVCFVGFKR